MPGGYSFRGYADSRNCFEILPGLAERRLSERSEAFLFVFSCGALFNYGMFRFGQAIWKRQISVYRRMGKVEKAVDELSQFLDTFYTDVEGWLELTDIYSSCNQ
jgi:hypothetical protein